MLFKSKRSKKFPNVTMSAKSKYDQANFMVENALGMFHTAISEIDQANVILEEDVNEKSDKIEVLNLELKNTEFAKEKSQETIEMNKKLRSKLSEFVG